MATIATVRHWRFYADGTEAGSTALAAEDTVYNLTVTADTIVLLRMGIDSFSATDTWGLTYSKNGGAGATVNGASSNVRGVASANLTDGANTSNRLTVPGGDTFSAQPGVVSQTGCVSSTIVIGTNNYVELLFAIVIKYADVANGNTLDFTLRSAGGAVTPVQFAGNVRLTITKPSTRRRGGAMLWW